MSKYKSFFVWRILFATKKNKSVQTAPQQKARLIQLYPPPKNKQAKLIPLYP
jgi:hypothetical protein